MGQLPGVPVPALMRPGPGRSPSPGRGGQPHPARFRRLTGGWRPRSSAGTTTSPAHREVPCEVRGHRRGHGGPLRGVPAVLLGEDPLLAGRVTARWPDSFRVTFAHQRSYRYNTAAADMFEPLPTGCDRSPGGGVIGAGAIDGGPATGSAGRPLSVAARRPVTRREHLRRSDRRAPGHPSPRPKLTAPPPPATRSFMEET
jgi:hypothetical protein